MNTISWLVGLTAILGLGLARAQEPQAPSYHVEKKFAIPGDGGWDYISVDTLARRLYVSHGTQLEVLDADSGKIIGNIPDSPRVLQEMSSRFEKVPTE